MTVKLIVLPLLVAVAVAPPPPLMLTAGFAAKSAQRLFPVAAQVVLWIESSFRSVTCPVAPVPPFWFRVKLRGAEVKPLPLAVRLREATEPGPTPTQGPTPSPSTCLIAGVVSG